MGPSQETARIRGARDASDARETGSGIQYYKRTAWAGMVPHRTAGGKGEEGRPCVRDSPQPANCSVCRRDALDVLNIDGLMHVVLPATSIVRFAKEDAKTGNKVSLET